VALAPDGRSARVVGVELREGESRRDLRLVSSAAMVVRGRALDADDGTPVPDARVDVGFPGIAAVTFTDASGAFELRDVPAIAGLRVYVTSRRHRAEWRVVPPAPGAPADLGEVRLRKVLSKTAH
jgi:hypothetical protein